MARRVETLGFVLSVSVLLVGATILFAVPGAAALGGSAVPVFDDPFFQTDDAEADDVLLEADLDENGDAVWTVEYRFLLADDESETAFDELETNIAENETPYVDRFRERMESTVATAEESTGREMTVSDVAVDTRRQTIGREYGIVVYSFTWGGFAAVEDDTIVAGDAVSGLFLDSDSRFVLNWPEGYEATEVAPEPTRTTPTSAIWGGPFEFATDEPRVTLAPIPPGEPTPTELTPTDPGGEPTDPGDEPTDPLDSGESPISSALVAGIVALLAGIGMLAYLRRRREASTAASPGTSTAAPLGGDDSGAAAGAELDSEKSASSTGAASAAAGAKDDSTEEPDSTPEELLSPEERVLKLLREHGGRMKQQEVVQEMDWTDARTSQVVGSLREEGKLESFRLGRENVLKLPDEEDEDEDEPGEA